MQSEQTVKCPICGEPYVVMAFYVGDQSACPSCVGKARRNDTKWTQGSYKSEKSDPHS